MKWQAAVAGAIASALITSVASAEMRVTNDPGGEITSYVTKFENLRASGERLVIDGPCLSACTLFTAFLPRQQVCVTPRAVLGFHAASYYDDASRSLVPTRAGHAAGDAALSAVDPQLDHAARRFDAANNRPSRPRTRFALRRLPLSGLRVRGTVAPRLMPRRLQRRCAANILALAVAICPSGE